MFHHLHIYDWVVIYFQRPEETYFVVGENCPILDKLSEQENSYSQKIAFITVQNPQGSGNDSSKGICLISFYAWPFCAAV